MSDDRRRAPEDPLGFVRRCIQAKRVFWTYHVNMRFGQRPISREMVLRAVNTFEIIEEYLGDKYMPSYLIRAEDEGLVFHVQVAADVPGDNVRIVTTYIPDPDMWEEDFRRRKL